MQQKKGGQVTEARKTAYALALDALARRDRSLSELESLLLRKGFAAEEVEQALRRVVELGYLNEERLAGSLIRDSRLAGRGPRAAWIKLKQRGVEGWSLERVQELWKGDASGPEGSEFSELETARAWIERRYPGFAEDRKEARRAMGALVRRGYSFDVAQAAVRPAGLRGEDP